MRTTSRAARRRTLGRSLPTAALSLGLGAALMLTGCSSDTLDIPNADEAAPAAPVTPAPAVTTSAPAAAPVDPATAQPDPAATAPALPEVDCTVALPAATVAETLDLPLGFVTQGAAAAGGTSCVYTIAGNQSAIQIAFGASSSDAASLAAQWATQPGSVVVPFGDAASLLAPETDDDESDDVDGVDDPAAELGAAVVAPTVLQSTAEGVAVSVYSYVGTDEQIIGFARAIYAALDISV